MFEWGEKTDKKDERVNDKIIALYDMFWRRSFSYPAS
jgi:hypothetical protein